MKKYEFTDETKTVNGIKLHRIRRLSDGKLGGFIQSEHNLSHDGDCFVYDDSCVFDRVRVYGNAQVYGTAWVHGAAHVYGDARVFDNAHVYGNALVFDSARVYNDARVYGDAQVYEDSVCTKTPLVCSIPRNTMYITDNNIIIGCQCHSIKYWEENIERIGKDNEYTVDEIKITKKLIKNLLKIRRLKC